MPPESEPEQPQTPSVPKGYFQRAAERIVDHWFEWVGIKSAGDDVKEHALIVEKKGRVLASAVIIVLLSVIGGCQIRGCHDENEVHESANLSQSNSVVAKIFEAQLQTSNQKNVTDKIDADEAKREKDTEIGDLKTENASLHSRVTSLEAAHVMELSSNFDGSISKIITGIAPERPIFKFQINNITLTNVDNSPSVVVSTTPIIIQGSRQIMIQVENLSKIPATHLTVNFTTDIDQTNILTDGWSQGLKQDFGRNSWRIISNDSVAQYGAFAASSLTISTNFHGVYLDGFFGVYADNSLTYEYAARFVFP